MIATQSQMEQIQTFFFNEQQFKVSGRIVLQENGTAQSRHQVAFFAGLMSLEVEQRWTDPSTEIHTAKKCCQVFL